MITLRSLSLLLVVALAGCGMEARVNSRNYSEALVKEADRGELMPPAATAAPTAMGRMMGAVTDGASATLVAVQPGSNLPTNSQAIARKIVYDAQVDLIVESVDPISKKVGSFVQEARGYVAEQTVTGSPGSQRSMRWRLRIPVEQFDSVVDSIVSLGELERNNRTSQDVTEQYYDIEARIKNKKLEEQTLNKILQERTGKLEDVLKIEVELSRVRGEIEQLEGKIRVLENLSSLATLTLNIRERDKYAPPAPVVADFQTQIARTWSDSLLDLENLGKSFTLWTVSWAIWVPFLLVAALLGWIVLRWLLRVFRRNLPRLIVLARTPIRSPRAPTASQ
jgi:polyhydroxyalkanoate synthesis regulator phasin